MMDIHRRVVFDGRVGKEVLNSYLVRHWVTHHSSYINNINRTLLSILCRMDKWANQFVLYFCRVGGGTPYVESVQDGWESTICRVYARWVGGHHMSSACKVDGRARYVECMQGGWEGTICRVYARWGGRAPNVECILKDNTTESNCRVISSHSHTLHSVGWSCRCVVLHTPTKHLEC